MVRKRHSINPEEILPYYSTTITKREWTKHGNDLGLTMVQILLESLKKLAELKEGNFF